MNKALAIEFEYSFVEKRGGCWGYFKTHTPTGRSKFVAKGWRTKHDAELALTFELNAAR